MSRGTRSRDTGGRGAISFGNPGASPRGQPRQSDRQDPTCGRPAVESGRPAVEAQVITPTKSHREDPGAPPGSAEGGECLIEHSDYTCTSRGTRGCDSDSSVAPTPRSCEPPCTKPRSAARCTCTSSPFSRTTCMSSQASDPRAAWCHSSDTQNPSPLAASTKREARYSSGRVVTSWSRCLGLAYEPPATTSPANT